MLGKIFETFNNGSVESLPISKDGHAFTLKKIDAMPDYETLLSQIYTKVKSQLSTAYNLEKARHFFTPFHIYNIF